MKNSLKNRLFSFLRQRPNEWTHGAEVERYGQTLGYKGETADRRVRELAEDKRIERKEVEGKVWYRYVPSQYEIFDKQYRSGQLSMNL